ncbi:MAG: formylglycine-generating enzyme family protein [Planctomycetota bacterium]|jgi:formylglycine-generating enzyme required for sulfatase activity
MATRASVAATLVVVLTCISALAADNAEAMRKLKAKDWKVPEIELKMKLIPAGSFMMGSPGTEMCRRKDEVRHRVSISKPFYMGVYEVTQRQFYNLMMPKDYDYKAWQFKRGPIADGAAYHFRPRPGERIMFHDAALGGKLTDLNPMECVSWERAREFCRKLTEAERKARRLPAGYVYRLPTEAEWEYACRAGTDGPYNVKGEYTNLAGLKKFAWLSVCHGWTSSTSEVGRNRTPNAWGLYDMHGNVYEWCLDWYGPYARKPVTDPVGPATGKEKVVRGGCFVLPRKPESADLTKIVHPFMRSASRYRVPPEVRYYGIVGFRIALAPSIKGASAR